MIVMTLLLGLTAIQPVMGIIAFGALLGVWGLTSLIHPSSRDRLGSDDSWS